MQPIDLTGKVAIVTGAGRGMGRSMALALARAGASVTITAARSTDELQATADAISDIGGADRVLCLTADVTDEADCLKVRDETLARLGGLHVLVNNAGRGHKFIHDANPGVPMDFWTADSNAWRLIVDTNVNGPFLMAKACTPYFLEQGFGRIVNIGATENTMSKGRNSPYGASKAALESETESWSRDLSGTGRDVTCNTLAPGGATLTGMVYGEGTGRNLLDPDIMGAPIVFLASHLSGEFNGRRFIAKLWNPEKAPDEAAMEAQLPSIFETR